MKKTFAYFKNHGKSSMSIILAAFVVAVLILAFIPVINLSSIAMSISKLEDNGYVVLAAGEYGSISTKLDNLKTSADAAVVKAELAANTSNETLTTLLLHNENEVFLFPDSTTVNVTFSTPGIVDTFGAWAEITDTSANTLSSNFTLNDGYLVEIMTHDYSANATDKKFIIEIATANDGTNVIGRVKARSDWTYVLNINSVRIVAGQTIYYRMKSEVAGAKLNADFRYYYR